MTGAEDAKLSKDLVDRLRAGDTAALDELLGLFGREVKAVAYTIVRNEADADEVAEDTFVTAWQKVHGLRDPTALRAWLLTVATRIAIRRRSRRIEVPLSVAESLAHSPDKTPMIIERAALGAALAALPPGMRAAIALHYVADLTVEEVAHSLGRSPNTIKSQLRQALRHLREALAEESQEGTEAGVTR